jgi:putative ABC transport system permease protein
MDHLLHDLRFALRQLRRSPVFTAVAVGTLALGIGANTAIFSAVDAVLLSPLPYGDPDRIVAVWEDDRLRESPREGFSLPDLEDLRDRGRSLSAIAGLRVRPASLTGTQGSSDAERVRVAQVMGDLPAVLGVGPARGRWFGAEEAKPGGAKAALLTDALWRRRFGADPAAVGRKLILDGEPHVIVGLLPPEVDLPGRPTDLWVPFQDPPELAPRGRHDLRVLARLAPGVTVEAASQEAAGIAAQLEREFADDNLGRGMRLAGLAEDVLGPVRPAFLVLLGAAGLLLLIACANVTGLLLARAADRSREIAVRSALGASGGRLVRLALTESLVLTGVAALLGVLAAAWGLDLLLALAPEDVPRLAQVEVDGRVLAFAACLALASGLVFGLATALLAHRRDLQGSLRSRTGDAAAPARARDLLVGAEVALSAVLLTGAGLLLQTVWNLSRVDPGYRPEGVLKLEVQLPEAAYPQPWSELPNWPRVHAFYGELLERVGRLPGVASVALAHHDPLDAGWTTRIAVEGRPEVAEGELEEINLRPVSPGYFQTVGLPLAAGRALSETDRTDAPPVLLLNQAGVRRHFPAEDPIGRRVAIFDRTWEVVGVVGDERFAGLAAPAEPAVYLSLAQLPMGSASLLVKTAGGKAGDPLALAQPVRQALRALDPGLAPFDLGTLEAGLARSVGRPRFTLYLVGAFAGTALLLAAAGVYALLAGALARRTQEIGVRLALGARRADILRLALLRGLAPALIGLALGLAGARAASRALAGQLFGVAPSDPATLAAVAVVLGAAALLAAWRPARRAAGLDPVTALRQE